METEAFWPRLQSVVDELNVCLLPLLVSSVMFLSLLSPSVTWLLSISDSPSLSISSWSLSLTGIFTNSSNSRYLSLKEHLQHSFLAPSYALEALVQVLLPASYSWSLKPQCQGSSGKNCLGVLKLNWSSFRTLTMKGSKWPTGARALPSILTAWSFPRTLWWMKLSGS